VTTRLMVDDGAVELVGVGPARTTRLFNLEMW
jgi:hypothetical protein